MGGFKHPPSFALACPSLPCRIRIRGSAAFSDSHDSWHSNTETLCAARDGARAGDCGGGDPLPGTGAEFPSGGKYLERATALGGDRAASAGDDAGDPERWHRPFRRVDDGVVRGGVRDPREKLRARSGFRRLPRGLLRGAGRGFERRANPPFQNATAHRDARDFLAFPRACGGADERLGILLGLFQGLPRAGKFGCRGSADSGLYPRGGGCRGLVSGASHDLRAVAAGDRIRAGGRALRGAAGGADFGHGVCAGWRGGGPCGGDPRRAARRGAGERGHGLRAARDHGCGAGRGKHFRRQRQCPRHRAGLARAGDPEQRPHTNFRLRDHG